MIPWIRKPALSRRRIVCAFAVAIVADGLQLLLGPAGWVFFDEAIDVVAMVLTSFLLGFHPLFIPTFVAEIVPVLDMLPTWTGCVLAVVAMSRSSAPKDPGQGKAA